MNNTIKLLKEHNYKVIVNHYRKFIAPLPDKSGGMNARAQIVYLPRYMKRSRFVKMQTHGGYSTVAIYGPSGALVDESIAFCADSDVFCYAKGVSECLRKIKNPVLSWD